MNPCHLRTCRTFLTSPMCTFLDSQCNADEVLAMIQLARYYPFVCALTTLPDGEDLIVSGASVSTDKLQKLAERTECIIVDVYDAVGYLMWVRNSGA